MSDAILKQLTQVLEQRKQASTDESYVASLHQKGLNKILEKVGEESVETILAARDARAQRKVAITAKLSTKLPIYGFTAWLCCRISI